MKFRGVLLKALDEQRDRDWVLINPAGVKFDPEHVYDVTQNNDYARIAGWAKLHREEDGSITAEGELSGFFSMPHQLAIQGIYEKQEFSAERLVSVVEQLDLMSLALTDTHPDETQPQITLEGT
jgi:hypothetical protein